MEGAGSIGEMTSVAYIGIGSNEGNRLLHCREALSRLHVPPTVRVKMVSSLYETDPMDYLDQARFYNAVAEIETVYSPRGLLNCCQTIEADLGKRVFFPKGPRAIDLDILFYGQDVIAEPDMVIPHPSIAVRPFVLIPLAEIAPLWVHPVLCKTIQALCSELTTILRMETVQQINHGFC